MRSYRNPFRYRTSEQETRQGLQRFLRTFGPGALDLLPDVIWDRPLVLQSAPGAGKTSLLRTFTAEALFAIAEQPDDFPELHARMVSIGALSEEGAVRVLGIRLAFKRNYGAIDDLRLDADGGAKVFFLLLDAHIVRATIEALVRATGETDLARLTWEPSAAGEPALDRLGGRSAADLMLWSRKAERDLLSQLDSVLPPRVENLRGHHAPYSVTALSGAGFSHAGEPLELRPLLMFDEGQEAGEHRRRALLDVLADRDLDLYRWYAERYQALSADEMIADGEPGRAYTPVRIEDEARDRPQNTGKAGLTRRFERLLREIADRRASNSLRTDADEERSFNDFLDPEFDRDDGRAEASVNHIQSTLAAIAGDDGRYSDWLELARGWRGYDGAVQCRTMQILMTRDQQRNQDTLFAVPLTVDEYKRLAGSDLREAAGLFLRKERALPFYAGPDRLVKLASENIEQHINISGQLYEELLALVTLGRPLGISALRQDAIVYQTSETLWRNIPMRRTDGRAIQRLLLHVAELCRADTYRPTAPYAPGATGTAISMSDRELLIDPAWRAEHPGADELFSALAGAVGHNLLRAELDRAVKGDRWMVLYLNRLLCARFGLPLGYGGFRERPIADLCGWMINEADEVQDEDVAEGPVQERLIP